MKEIFFLFSFVFLFQNLEAKTIDEVTAKTVASNFIYRQLKNGKTQVLETSYISTKKDVNSFVIYANFYVFNIVDGEGFVVVSADDNVEPILGYSLEKDFEIGQIPKQVSNWLEDYSTQIGIVIENKISSKSATAKWNNLLSNIIIKEKALPTAVKPLLKTTWNQNPYYNDLCPTDNGVKTVTGCVATAMAQAMKYWNYPTTGTGSKTYTAGTYGSQTANFGATTYNWVNMPNNINSSNTEIARLMYHCGVAIEMNYGTAASGGSSAYNTYDPNYPTSPCAHLALKDYFKYDANSIASIYKKNYTDQTWTDKIKSEITQARVVIFEGSSSTGSGGHCFVADGFDVNNFIHFNWGWGGSYNGYFSVTSLIPSGTGTGGGTGNYTSNQGAVIGIKPPTTSAPVADFSASSTVTNVNSTIALSDLSTNIPSSWTWTITPSTFTFVNGTSNNSKFPEVMFTASGKYTIKLEATNSIGTGISTKTAYILVNPAIASKVCDTLTNFSTTDLKMNYTITGGGYMAGHNVSMLKGYAEYYSSYTPYTHISGVVLEFAHAEASNSTNTISVNLYSNINNKPDAILTSKTVKLIDIVNDVNNNIPTTVLFDTPYELTEPFYVGYTLTYAAGDSVSVYIGKSGTITTNTSFFQYPNDSWCDYKTCWGTNQHLKISPMISTLPTPNFTITPSLTKENSNVNIDASSSIEAYAYNWTIENANITSSKFYKETISYSNPGIYNIVLDVTGGCGNTKQITKQIYICTIAPATPGAISGINSVCPGSTNVTYTVAAVSGAFSYDWSLPTGITGTSTTNSITVNISNTIQSGSIKVRAVNSCGTSAFSIAFEIIPLIKTTATFTLVNTDPVCSGTLLPSLPTQSLEGIIGQWAPEINNTTTTTYTFTPTSGQCSTATLSITINPLPTVTINSVPTNICLGQKLTLTGAGAQSYSWNNNVINSISFTPTLGTLNYIVTGTETTNGCTNTANVSVTTHSFPTVVANASSTMLCTGQQLTLSGSGSQIYNWDNSVANAVAFTPSLGTKTYTVIGDNGYGCTNTNKISVTVNQSPTVTATASSTTIYEGKSVTLTGSGAQSYTWNNGITNGVAFKPLVGAITYTVTGTASNKCTNTANVLVTVLSSVGLEDLNLNDSFNAYFNNATDELIINATIDKASNIIVTLINSAGQEIYNQKYISYIGEFNSNINVNTFETGVYILKIDTNQGVISKKFVLN